MNQKIVRIGSASGFWGDTAVAAPQLLDSGQVQYLVFDYLAEVTMSIMAAARAKDPSFGYATDFVQITMKSLLAQIRAQGVKVVANAGGVNPLACRDALARVAEELGVPLRIGVVLGDDLAARSEEFRNDQTTEMFSGAAFPQRVASVNAYLGALPIARALQAGCDVVITGRCVDSAVTLGVLIHEFGWRDDDYDRLAQGTLAGHLVECGAQCTGGLFTDWDTVPDWDNIGFPILEASADGSFMITKPAGTGGLVTTQTVSEQLLYEIGDPRAYLVPDVTCDFTDVRFEQIGPERVRVSGARGMAPTSTYKVSATFADGYRNIAVLVIGGEDAAAKARRTGEALLKRTSRMLDRLGLPAYTETRIEVLGAEDMFGKAARPVRARSGAQDRGQGAVPGKSGSVRARVRALRHLDVAWHDRSDRRQADSLAGNPVVLVPACQGSGTRRTRHRRRAQCGPDPLWRRLRSGHAAGCRALRRRAVLAGSGLADAAVRAGRPWSLRRQGRQGQHRHHRPYARIFAVVERLADATAGRRMVCAQCAEPG